MAGTLTGLLRRMRALPRSESRTVMLDGRPIGCRLRRSARRTLAMRLDDEGVLVSVPLHVGADEAERFVLAHAGWLRRRLEERRAAQAVAAFRAEDGVRFPLHGADCRLRVEAGRRRAVWSRDADGEVLHVGEDDPATALVRALRARALPEYRERVGMHCERLGLAPPPVRLTSARTRWGSCSTRSGIRLHWRLMHLEPELIDYVVAHEVAHLVEMNHSPAFWTIVGKLHPDWQASRRRLRERARTLPVIERGAGAVPASGA